MAMDEPFRRAVLLTDSDALFKKSGKVSLFFITQRYAKIIFHAKNSRDEFKSSLE